MSDNIQVAVRMRPLIAREREGKASIHWKAEGSCILQKNQTSTKFQFDRVFREIDTNEIVYTEFCEPLVRSVIDGFNGTIFAYGQTSSGKSYTMMGKDDGKELGIIHHTISDIFNHIQEMSEREFLLRVSYMEIYNEAIIDLLSDKNENLKLKEDRDGVIKVSGLSEHIVQKPDQVLHLMRKGEKKRKIGDTNMNEKSSRSHSIFQVIIESGIRGKENSAVNVSQFNLVDLAGSERASQTGAKGTRFKESVNINKSLLTLSHVISQLSERPDQFINYRDSKLTRILQNSLGGNAKTAVICTITPATVEETVSTLKFATRAKCIRNKPQVNEILTEQALLKRYANEIKKLTQELEATKEEKAQENKNLKEQIMSLKNKFVSQMALKNERRSTRRETWGGCLDAAKFKGPFPPRSILRPQRYLPVESLSEDLTEDSIVATSASSEKDLIRTVSTGRSQCSDLSTVEEECELEVFDGTFSSRQSKYLSSNLPLYSETGVQTDVSPEKKQILSDPELISALQTTVKKLKDELSELKEFTSLEKQIMRACKRTSSNFEDLIKEYGNVSLKENSPEELSIQILDTADMKEKNNCQVLSNDEPDGVCLKLALNMFKEIKQFTIEFMKKNIDEVYFREVSKIDSSNKHATVQEYIQEESNTIKELLRRIEFYLKNKCESFEYFQNVLRDTSNEVFDLKSKLEDTEYQLNQNEVKMKELVEVFKELESNALVFMEKFDAPKSLKWKDSITSTVLSTVLKYIPMLKIVIKMLKYFVEEESLMSKNKCSSDKQESTCRKISKSVQTVEDERAIQISKEMEKLKTEKAELLIDVTHLESRIENIKKFREEAESRFREKETRYKTEIEDLKLLFDAERNALTENAKNCVQSVEEKYDQIINEQEIRFCEELERVKEGLKGQVQEKDLYKEIAAKHEEEITQLNKKQMNLQDQLSKAFNDHCNERREYENTISTLKEELSSRAEVITKLRFKYKSYASELQKLKAKAEKSTRDWGIQTDPSQIRDEKSDKVQTSSSNGGLSAPTTSTQSNKNINEQAAKMVAIKNEALIKEVEELKKELRGKIQLLKTCRCRLAPRPQVRSQQVCEKCLESDGNMAQKKDAKSSGNRGGEIIFSSAADILQSDIVKNAIELEIERERYKLSDSGTASTLVNCMLKKDLDSKERALAAAKKEIAELKAYARKRNAFPVNENRPFLLPSLEEKDVTLLERDNHPFPYGEVPKLPPKNMLKERNKGAYLPHHPLATGRGENRHVFGEKPVISSICISKDPSVKENNNEKEGRKKDLVQETKEQLESFESSQPECKQQ